MREFGPRGRRILVGDSKAVPESGADPGPYYADQCPCGHRACKAWHVWPAAAVQGVRFTQRQAEAVAELLNKMQRGEV